MPPVGRAGRAVQVGLHGLSADRAPPSAVTASCRCAKDSLGDPGAVGPTTPTMVTSRDGGFPGGAAAATTTTAATGRSGCETGPRPTPQPVADTGVGGQEDRDLGQTRISGPRSGITHEPGGARLHDRQPLRPAATANGYSRDRERSRTTLAEAWWGAGTDGEGPRQGSYDFGHRCGGGGIQICRV